MKDDPSLFTSLHKFHSDATDLNVRDHEGPKGREMQRGRQKRQTRGKLDGERWLRNLELDRT